MRHPPHFMKVLLKCSKLKYEDIKKIEYVDSKVKIYTVDRILEYSIRQKCGTYIVITDDNIEYYNMENL
ncbi:uncharacterized protein VNE69_04185 [Vairimorpha necatrix]|uniref:Uncharacterized protein n=1 Tax=Vairimorpha necatrix TaxID=6039 RepID=A0AAX4JBL6_9MICR